MLLRMEDVGKDGSEDCGTVVEWNWSILQKLDWPKYFFFEFIA